MSKLFVHFIIRFSIPWIWKWDFRCDYQNKIPRLKRIFFTKWWDKGLNPTLPELLKTIKNHTQACLDVIPQSLPSPVPINPFVKIQADLKQKFPNLTETELIVKTMDYMKTQFLQSLVSDDVSMKTASDEESEQDDNQFNVLAGESQEPEPTMGDFWDSLTSMISEKLEQDKKGKGKAV